MTHSTITSSRRAQSARASFFVRIGQVKRIDERYDRETLPLWPLALILDADGTLAADARELAQKVRA